VTHTKELKYPISNIGRVQINVIIYLNKSQMDALLIMTICQWRQRLYYGKWNTV